METTTTMTGADIIKILFEDLDMSYETFGYGEDGEWDEIIPYDFPMSEAAEQSEKEKDEAYDEMKQFRLNDANWRNNPAYDQLSEQWSNTPGKHEVRLNEFLDSIGIGGFKIIETTGGSDDTPYCTVVYHFPAHDVYLKMEGYYQSYDGYYWDEAPYEVKPVEKTITVYTSES